MDLRIFQPAMLVKQRVLIPNDFFLLASWHSGESQVSCWGPPLAASSYQSHKEQDGSLENRRGPNPPPNLPPFQEIAGLIEALLREERPWHWRGVDPWDLVEARGCPIRTWSSIIPKAEWKWPFWSEIPEMCKSWTKWNFRLTHIISYIVTRVFLGTLEYDFIS